MNRKRTISMILVMLAIYTFGKGISIAANGIPPAGITFTLPEIIGLLGGMISFFILVISFFIRRTVFQKLDDLDKGRQDKGFCDQRILFCNTQAKNVNEDIAEIKAELKEGRKQFQHVNTKLDRIMGHLKISSLIEEDWIKK